MGRRAWSALWVLLAMLWATVAWAGVDGHGNAPFPDDGDPADPIWGWRPEVGRPGVPSLGVSFDGALAPLVRERTVGGEVVREVLLGDYLALDLAGTVGVARRLSVGLSLPVFFAAGDGAGPPALGDLVLVAPVGLLLPGRDGEGLGVGVAPVLRLPTGNADRWVGDGGVGGGLRAAIGWGGGPVHLAGSLGVDARRWRSLPDDPTTTAVQGTADVSAAWRVADPVTLQVALRGATSPVEGVPPIEALVGARGASRRGPWWVVGVATGLTDGVTASALRGYVGVGYTPPRPVEEVVGAPVPDAPVAPALVPARVNVSDASGAPLPQAAATWSSAEAAWEGRDVALEPGGWTLDVAMEGRGAQSRTLAIVEGARPVEVDVYLAPIAGDADLALTVVGPGSEPVDGASVRIDGAPLGTIGVGVLGVTALAPGAHRLAVDAEGWEPVEQDIELQSGRNSVTVTMRRAPGSVTVIARGPNGPVPDAVVRFDGPSRLPPLALGEDGRRVVQVRPGPWTVLVVSPSSGLQRREIVVPEDAVLTVVDVFLRPEEGGEADLAVRVVDPDGDPVADAEVRIDGQTLGRTSSGGSVSIDGLAVGPRRLEVAGEWLRPAPPVDLFLVAGAQEALVRVGWLPGTVRVTARTSSGPIDDAVARFSGPHSVDPLPLGPEGRAQTSLPDGSWRALVVSEQWGLQEREVVVPPDATTRIDVDVVLGGLPPGPADVVVVVTGPDGRAVPDAQVAVDGVQVGSTSTAGTVRLQGIATGARTVTVTAASYAPRTVSTRLAAGEQTVFASLSYAPGAVLFVARSTAGPVDDAVVRLAGPARMPPLAVDAAGERLVVLSPGRWQALALSPTHGLVEERFEVRETGGLARVDLLLVPVAEGEAALLVRVVDVEGNAVSGASVSLGGEGRGTTAEGGVLLVGRLSPGLLALRVEAAGFEGATSVGEIREGVSERLVVLTRVPRRLAITVADAAGRPVVAEIRAEGAEDVPRAVADAGGRAALDLRPGAWQIVARAPGLGTAAQQVTIAPDADPAPLAFILGDSLVDLTADAVLIRERVHFDFDRATIRPESGAVLAQVAATLIGDPSIARVEVQGHTDRTGEPAYNLDLSRRRAQAVVDALVALGVAPERLVASGYGPSRPVTEDDSEEGRALNRRVQFEIRERTPTER